MIRVIAGRAKGRRLWMVKGDITRPVADRVKEALFNILSPLVAESQFLDLFAGTGSVGIEALSRGAAQATFVERHPRAIEVIRANLELTGLAEWAVVEQSDVFEYLRAPAQTRFDLVYVAPPQYSELWSRTVQLLDSRSDWLNPDAWVIAQMHPREHKELELAALEQIDLRTYGTTRLAFYARPGS